MHTTKNRSVSSAQPGPINFSHQPARGLSGVECACELADRPVCSRITLSLAAASVPHVSYATVNSRSTPPLSSSSGSLEVNDLCAPVVYDGSGPSVEKRVSSCFVRDSMRSMQGKAMGGFDALVELRRASRRPGWRRRADEATRRANVRLKEERKLMSISYMSTQTAGGERSCSE